MFHSLFIVLKKCFENVRIIVHIHIKAILEFDRIIHESSKLKRLADVANEISELSFNK